MARHDRPADGQARAVPTRKTIANQIRVCDDVIAQLTALDTPDVTDLIDDVTNLRASLQQRVAIGL